jgi:catechol 2,3-dioxygenase-like lactoylglutathione lyase family enzyme
LVGDHVLVFDHVGITVSDLTASRAFYHEALGLPDVEGEFIEWGDFGIQAIDDQHLLTKNLHVAFGVEDRDAVDAWWSRLIEAGYTSAGEPGPRPQYSDSYYGAFILDPDGNSIEAVHHDRTRPGEMQHLWFRTRDLAAARRFYETLAPVVGLEIRHDSPERVQLSDGRGNFTFVPGELPTENVHVAFGVGDLATVVRFHEVATAAGYTDNGPPGERPQYHPGYYGAFVFDPDSHNVEAVFHDRRSGA